MNIDEFESGCLGCGCFIVIIIVLGFFIYCIDRYSCKKIANTLGYACEYSIWTDCVLIKPDGKKVLLKQLRDFERSDE